MSAKGPVVMASGAGGEPPGGGGRKGFDGHYAPDGGAFTPLPKGMKMAGPGPNRDAARVPPGPGARRRAMSLPSANDLGFTMALRSVMTHGILPQPEMRRRNIGFDPSHDGPLRDAQHVEVTRVPRVADPIQQRDISRAAVENPYHGSLTVALERRTELPFRAQSDNEVRGGMDLAQRFDMLRMSADDSRMVINARRSNVLTDPQGLAEASRRSHASFSVLSRASAPSDRTVPFETQRPSVRPRDMREVHVPFQHMPDARRVARDLRQQGRQALPELVPVGDTNALAPRYNTRHGTAISTEGVTAPAYDQALGEFIQRHGAADQHLVRTPLRQAGGGGLAPMLPGAGRRRANTR